MKIIICFMAILFSFSQTNTDRFAVKNKEGIFIHYKIDRETKTASVIRNRQQKYSGSITIPSQIKVEGISYTVTTIEESAFEGCEELIAVTLPESVTTIGDYAFSQCSSLKEFIIPPTVTTIGGNALSRCSGLKKLIIEDGPERLDMNHNLNNSPIEQVYLGRNLPISPFGYPGFNNLTEVTIGNQVTTLPDNAFGGCIGLKIIVFPESLQHIPYSAFGSCTSLTQVTIPNSIKSIGKEAFRNCKNLTEITIPNSVNLIDFCAFYDCPNLKKIIIEDSTHPIEIGYSAFYNHSVESVYIGRNFTANGTFSHMFELTELTIAPQVTSIEERAFTNSRKLTRLQIPDSITSIGEGAFSACYGLKELTIPESVISIGDNAFSACYGLNELTIAESVISIGEGAFAPCELSETGECWTTSALTIINCKTPIPPETGPNNFEVVKKETCTLYIPIGSTPKYKEHPIWGTFPNIKETDF